MEEARTFRKGDRVRLKKNVRIRDTSYSPILEVSDHKSLYEGEAVIAGAQTDLLITISCFGVVQKDVDEEYSHPTFVHVTFWPDAKEFGFGIDVKIRSSLLEIINKEEKANE